MVSSHNTSPERPFIIWTVLSTSYFQRDGGPRTPAIDLA
jgi:hypothetical protein